MTLFGSPTADSSFAGRLRLLSLDESRPKSEGSSGLTAYPSIDLDTAGVNTMASPTTAGKVCEPLCENSGGGRVTDSPPPHGEPAQAHDYSAHAHWDHNLVRSAANGRECTFQPTALNDLSIQFESGTFFKKVPGALNLLLWAQRRRLSNVWLCGFLD